MSPSLLEQSKAHLEVIVSTGLKMYVPPTAAEQAVELVAEASVLGSGILEPSHQSPPMEADGSSRGAMTATDSGDFSGKSLTVYWRESLEDELRSSVARTTLVDYRSSVKLWGRITGDPPIAEIRTSDIVALRNWFVENTKSAAYFNSTLGALRVVMRRLSVNWDESEVPPLPKPPRFQRLRETERQVIIFTRAELSRLYLAADSESELKSPACWPRSSRPMVWRALFVLLTIYGQRVMDVANRLDWSWIDFQRKRIRFKQSKTGKVPDLPLHWVAYWHLRSWWKFCGEPVSGSVFGFPQNRKSRLKDWKKLLSRAELPLKFDCHDFRRTCASMYGAIRHGDAADWICGWAPRGVKAKVYSEVTDTIRQALKAFPVPKAMGLGAKDLRDVTAKVNSETA